MKKVQPKTFVLNRMPDLKIESYDGLFLIRNYKTDDIFAEGTSHFIAWNRAMTRILKIEDEKKN